MASMTLSGAKEIAAELRKARRVLTGPAGKRALRAGAEVVRREIASRAPRADGALQDGIVATEPEKSGRTLTTHVGPGSKLFYARFVEFGTSAHEIPKLRKKHRRKGLRPPPVKIGSDIIRARVQHPGQAAQPFIRPGAEAARASSVRAMRDVLSGALR